ncbi:MAG: glutamate racemase [Chlorobi bacterium]|nr:glutamate racemase [Chlorobiota bacterium]
MRTRFSPIGLFDSGIGGLSVARQVMRMLPNENIVYFGDTARVPYGTKSPETVIGYSLQAAAFLRSQGVKLIIIACNTASAVALQAVQLASEVPVIGVIQPGAAAAVAATRNGRVGVIGTQGTVQSLAYQNAITDLSCSTSVLAQPCPLFVTLAEEGHTYHPGTLIFAREYLHPLLRQSIDTLILGCTHYPLLQPSISEVCGPAVTLIDPGIATAQEALHLLEHSEMRNSSTSLPRYEYYLTDLPLKFIEVGERFLGRKLDHVHRVQLDDLPNIF